MASTTVSGADAVTMVSDTDEAGANPDVVFDNSNRYRDIDGNSRAFQKQCPSRNIFVRTWHNNSTIIIIGGLLGLILAVLLKIMVA
ncbi:hypothetical protein LTR08_001345 [Meristemomyces frigidus]|nr:hypothetical protein LTR08_001345 [Meristemomyces frigidus]